VVVIEEVDVNLKASRGPYSDDGNNKLSGVDVALASFDWFTSGVRGANMLIVQTKRHAYTFIPYPAIAVISAVL
jgi:hypothetical protein